MRKLKYLLIYTFLAFVVISCSDKDNNEGNETDTPILPNKELRGVWVATAWGLDWPMEQYDETSEKELYLKYLDILASNNMNAIFFQVRPMQGLFYESEYESWSQYITGTFGKDPNWDVMTFLIEEAHKRGIEFHAWFNPYRIATRANDKEAFPTLDSKISEELVKDYGTIRMYNPALPQVQERIGLIIKEFLTKYNVDGIHIDDYFYPAGVSGLGDDADYKIYGKDFANVDAFRRNNVDIAITNIKNAIVSIRPEVVFSVSPAGNNDYNYNTMYADVLKWSQQGMVDVIIPQLYYTMGSGSGSFNQSLHWWSQFTYNNILMVGYGVNNFAEDSTNDKYKSNTDLTNQFAFAKTRKKVKGGVLYSAKYLVSNPVDIMAAIKDAYKYPSFTPYIGRPAIDVPFAPSGLIVSGNTLSWNVVDGALRYAVYKSNGSGKVAQMIALTSGTTQSLPEVGEYFVTAVGKYNVESEISSVVSR